MYAYGAKQLVPLSVALTLAACPAASNEEADGDLTENLEDETAADSESAGDEATESGSTESASTGDASTDSESTEGESTDTESTSTGGSGSAGCGVPLGAVEVSLEVGTDTRTFVLHLPPGYDPDQTYPLMFAIHGLGGSGGLAQNYFGIQALAGGEAIIVYPDALPLASQGGQTGWDLTPQGYDFEFFDALYDHLAGSLCIDEGRVFATGHSFGGYMSNSLGCYRGERFAAIAPVAGGGPFFGACDGPVATWLTHGSNDNVVAFSEGENSRDSWAMVNACGDGVAEAQPEGCVSYVGCSADVHWCPHDGGHEWPAFAPAAIWAFFQAH